MFVTAIVPAAGAGKRFGAPKQFLPLDGVPLLARTLLALLRSEVITSFVIVVPPGQETLCREIVARFLTSVEAEVVGGGAERQESVYCGLMRVKSTTDLVVVHDGVRPFVPPELLCTCLKEAELWGAAVAAVPAKETLKQVDGEGFVTGTPERRTLWIDQTPQAFCYDLIIKAHWLARVERFVGTDDAVLVERLGARVKVVLGSYDNIKITTPQDLFLAEQLLRQGVFRL